MPKSFEVEGLKELEKELLKLEAKVGVKLLKQAGRQAMKPVLAAAQSSVSVDSGDLKSALSIKALTGKRGKSVAIIQVGAHRKKLSKKQGGRELTNVNQKAIALEYGTKKQKPKPFLLPSFEPKIPGVLSTFKEQLAKRIIKAKQ